MGDMLVFDCETTTVNPYDDEARLLTFQFKKNNDDVEIYAIWENRLTDEPMTESELDIAENLLLNRIEQVFLGLDGFSDIITYNGLFDILYLIGRYAVIHENQSSRFYFHDVILNKRFHHDMMSLYMYQNNGYPMTLSKLCRRKLGVRPDSDYVGKDIPQLFREGNYDDILLHATDDVEMTYLLAKSRPEMKVLARKNKRVMRDL